MVRGGTPLGDKGKGQPVVNGGSSRSRSGKQQTEPTTADTSVAKRTRGAQHHDHATAASPVTPSGKKQAGKQQHTRSTGKRLQTGDSSAEHHANGDAEMQHSTGAADHDHAAEVTHGTGAAHTEDANGNHVKESVAADGEHQSARAPETQPDAMAQQPGSDAATEPAADSLQPAPAASGKTAAAGSDGTAAAAVAAENTASAAGTEVADQHKAADTTTTAPAQAASVAGVPSLLEADGPVVVSADHTAPEPCTSAAGGQAAASTGEAAVQPVQPAAVAGSSEVVTTTVKQEPREDVTVDHPAAAYSSQQQTQGSKSAGRSTAPKRKRASELEQMMADAQLVLRPGERANGGASSGHGAGDGVTAAAADGTPVTAQHDVHGSDHGTRYPSRARRTSGAGTPAAKDNKDHKDHKETRDSKDHKGTLEDKDSKVSKEHKDKKGVTHSKGQKGGQQQEELVTAAPASGVSDKGTGKTAAAAVGSKAGPSSPAPASAKKVPASTVAQSSPPGLQQSLSKAASNAAHTVAVPEPQGPLVLTPAVAMDVDLVSQPPLPLPVPAVVSEQPAAPIPVQAGDGGQLQQALERSQSGLRHSARRHRKTSKAIEMDDVESEEETDEDWSDMIEYKPKQPSGKAGAAGGLVHASKTVKTERQSIAGGEGQEPSSKRFRPSDPGSGTRTITTTMADAVDAQVAGRKRKESEGASDGYVTIKQLPAMYDPFAVSNPPTYLAPLVSPMPPAETTPAVVFGSNNEQYKHSTWDSKLTRVVVAVPPAPTDASSNSNAYHVSPPQHAPPPPLIGAPAAAPAPPPPPLAPPPPPTTKPSHKKQKTSNVSKPSTSIVAPAPPPPLIQMPPVLPEDTALAPPPPPIPGSAAEAPPAAAPLPPPASPHSKTKIHIHVKAHSKKGGKAGSMHAQAASATQHAPETQVAPPPPPITAPVKVDETDIVLAPPPPPMEAAPPPPSTSPPPAQQQAAPAPPLEEAPMQPSSEPTKQISQQEPAAPAVPSQAADAAADAAAAPSAAQVTPSAAQVVPEDVTEQEGPGQQPGTAAAAATAAEAEQEGAQQPAEVLTDPRLILAQKIREHYNYHLPGSLNSKHLMQTGLLDGMDIEYRKRDITSRVVMGTGMFESGLVRCYCSECKYRKELVNLGTFELHSGSLNKKPIEHVFFTHLGINLKELIMLIQGEPISAHGGMYFPWPDTKNSRGGHSSHSVIGPRRAQAGVAQLIAAERASARSLAPGAGQEEEEAALAAMAAAHTASKAARMGGRRVPAPPSSLAALNLPLHATTKAKPVGPTIPDEVPMNFRLDYWLEQCNQGLFRPATTERGATLPEQEEKAGSQEEAAADKGNRPGDAAAPTCAVLTGQPAADSNAIAPAANGTATAAAAAAPASGAAAADVMMQDSTADAAGTVSVPSAQPAGTSSQAPDAVPLVASGPAGDAAQAATAELKPDTMQAAGAGQEVVAMGSKGDDNAMLVDAQPTKPEEQAKEEALQAGNGTVSLVLEPPPVQGTEGAGEGVEQGTAQADIRAVVETQEGQEQGQPLPSQSQSPTAAEAMQSAVQGVQGPAAQGGEAVHSVLQPAIAVEPVPQGPGLEAVQVLHPAQDAAMSHQLLNQQGAGSAVQSLQAVQSHQPDPAPAVQPQQAEQQAALQVLQALQQAPQPVQESSSVPPAEADLQPFLQLLQGAPPPMETPSQQLHLQQLLEALQTPQGAPTSQPQLPEQSGLQSQLQSSTIPSSDVQARQEGISPRELQMQELNPVVDDKFRTMAHVDGQWVPRPAHIGEPPRGKMVKGSTQRNKNKHQRLFEPGEGSLKHGQHVTYRLHGQNLLEGHISMDGKGATGILCYHCNTIISPSTFEAHAGHKQRRNPYDAIITDDGVSLRDLALRLPPLPEELNWAYVPIPTGGAGGGDKGAGRVSGSGKAGGGSGGSKQGSGAAAGQGNRNVLNNLLARGRMPALMPGANRVGRGRAITFGTPRSQQRASTGRAEDSSAAAAAAAAAAVAAASQQQADAAAAHEADTPQLSAITSSCVICFDASFDREGFSDRTVLICDQCEREFHVGCLQRQGHTQLQKIPEGHWFCSAECSLCHAALNAQVEAGEMVVSEDGHTLRVMKGRDGSLGTARNLHQVLETLQEGFDPILSSTDGMDMLPSMVLAVEHGDFDFQGMYSLLLKHRGKPVCAGLMRVFGSSLAELPLIATKLASRRQGHAKVFMRVLEERLRFLKVRILALPAAHDAVVTWVRGFKFRYLHPSQLQYALAELRLLLFPGTQVMYKDLTGSASGDSDFKGVEGAPPYLTGAYPAGLPEEILAVVDQQAKIISDDCYQHQLDPEPWMPPPSATAVAALEAAKASGGPATPAAPALVGGTTLSKAKPPSVPPARQPQAKLPTPPPAVPLQAALPPNPLRFPSPGPQQLPNLSPAMLQQLPAIAQQLAQQSGSPAAAAAALARMPQAAQAMMIAAAAAALQNSASSNPPSAQRQRASPSPLSMPPFQSPGTASGPNSGGASGGVSALQLQPGALQTQQSAGLQVVSPSAPKAADLPTPLDLSAPQLASNNSLPLLPPQ